MNSKAKYYPTAFVLYLNYFVQGIATGVRTADYERGTGNTVGRRHC